MWIQAPGHPTLILSTPPCLVAWRGSSSGPPGQPADRIRHSLLCQNCYSTMPTCGSDLPLCLWPSSIKGGSGFFMISWTSWSFLRSDGPFSLPLVRSDCPKPVAFFQKSGNMMAGIRYGVILSPEAADIKGLKPHLPSAIPAAIEEHLRFEPKRESTSRIKKQRSIDGAQYRVRVDDIRVFYDEIRKESIPCFLSLQRT